MISWIGERRLLRPPMLALASYVALCCGLLVLTLVCFVDAIKIVSYHSGLDEAQFVATPEIRDSAALFLHGSSASIARAELLKHVSVQIANMGGNIVSSSLDQITSPVQQIATIKTDFTMENAQLQKLLYSLEAGTPLLFIDRLSVRSDPKSNTPYVLRVEMTVSGVWREART
jgi:type II secretion system (T2SS) protein M